MRSVLLLCAVLLASSLSTDVPPGQPPEKTAGGSGTTPQGVDGEDGGDPSDEDCHPTLHGRLSSCHPVQIATLSASPRRCVTISGVPPLDDDAGGLAGCVDLPGWFDGTYGCSAYAQNLPAFCEKYGSIDYRPHSDRTADQACCACGGGQKVRPKFQVGEHAVLAGMQQYAGCLFKVTGVDNGGSYKHHGHPSSAVRVPFRYSLEVTGPCGPMVWKQDPGTGVNSLDHMHGPGYKV